MLTVLQTVSLYVLYITTVYTPYVYHTDIYLKNTVCIENEREGETEREMRGRLYPGLQLACGPVSLAAPLALPVSLLCSWRCQLPLLRVELKQGRAGRGAGGERGRGLSNGAGPVSEREQCNRAAPPGDSAWVSCWGPPGGASGPAAGGQPIGTAPDVSSSGLCCVLRRSAPRPPPQPCPLQFFRALSSVGLFKLRERGAGGGRERERERERGLGGSPMWIGIPFERWE
jgi:hypothetical protein